MKLTFTLEDLEALERAFSPVFGPQATLKKEYWAEHLWMVGELREDEVEARLTAAREMYERIRTTIIEAKREPLGGATKPASFVNVLELEIAEWAMRAECSRMLDAALRRRWPKNAPPPASTKTVDRMGPDERQRYEVAESLERRLEASVKELKRTVTVDFDVTSAKP